MNKSEELLQDQKFQLKTYKELTSFLKLSRQHALWPESGQQPQKIGIHCI